jgi:hypothetical protein
MFAPRVCASGITTTTTIRTMYTCDTAHDVNRGYRDTVVLKLANCGARVS